MKLAACATFLLAAGSNAFAPGAGNTRSTGELPCHASLG